MEIIFLAFVILLVSFVSLALLRRSQKSNCPNSAKLTEEEKRIVARIHAEPIEKAKKAAEAKAAFEKKAEQWEAIFNEFAHSLAQKLNVKIEGGRRYNPSTPSTYQGAPSRYHRDVYLWKFGFYYKVKKTYFNFNDCFAGLGFEMHGINGPVGISTGKWSMNTSSREYGDYIEIKTPDELYSKSGETFGRLYEALLRYEATEKDRRRRKLKPYGKVVIKPNIAQQ